MAADANTHAAVAPASDTEAGSPAVTLSSEAVLALSQSLYETGRYEQCAVLLSQWLEAKREGAPQSDQIDQAKIYLGACLIASGRSQQADRVYKDALRDNPQMRAPDSLIFPQTVVDRFLRVREQFLTDIRQDEQKRIDDAENRAKEQDARKRRDLEIREQLRAMARQETVVERNRRWLASVPFGVGQFQNGDTAAGWAFLSVETVLAGTCITALVLDAHLANTSREPGVDLAELRAKRLDAYRAIVLSSWGLLGVTVGGILHAHLRFVPERRTIRMRPLPAELEAPAPSETPRSPQAGRTSSKSGLSVDVAIGPALGIVGSF